MIKKIVALLSIAVLTASISSYAEEIQTDVTEKENSQDIVLYEEPQENSEAGILQDELINNDSELVSMPEHSMTILGESTVPEMRLGKDGASYEFEDVFEWAKVYVVDDENASGGKCVRSGGATAIPSKGYSQEVKLIVKDAGKYSIHFLTQMVRENSSAVSVTLDGEQFVDNSNGTSYSHFSTAVSALSGAQGSQWVEDFWIEKELTAGEHTLVMAISRESFGYNAITFDSIYFYQPKEYTSIDVKYDDYAAVGDELKIDISDQDGALVNSRNYLSLNYTTTTPKIVGISGDKIVLRNPGKAEITMTLTTSEREFTKNITFDVVAKNGLVVKSVEKGNNKLKVCLYAAKAYSAKENITLVSYDTVRDVKTSFIDKETQKIPDIAEGQEATVEFDLTSWEGYKVLNLFLHKNAIGQSFSIISISSNIK